MALYHIRILVYISFTTMFLYTSYSADLISIDVELNSVRVWVWVWDVADQPSATNPNPTSIAFFLHQLIIDFATIKC